MLPRYAGIIQISLEGLFSAPPINGAPLENRLQRYNYFSIYAKKSRKNYFLLLFPYSEFSEYSEYSEYSDYSDFSTPAYVSLVLSEVLAQTM